MEETVIWEQHTVTLHRVSVYSVPFTLPLLFSGLHPFPVHLRHPKRCTDVVCVEQIFVPVPLPVQLFSLSVLRASCSSRMCSTETIVKKPRWQETRLRKTKISIYFLTTSFHFLPVGSMLFLTQLQGKRCIIVSLHVLFCPVVRVFVIDFKNLLTSVAKIWANDWLHPLAQSAPSGLLHVFKPFRGGTLTNHHT